MKDLIRDGVAVIVSLGFDSALEQMMHREQFELKLEQLVRDATADGEREPAAVLRKVAEGLAKLSDAHGWAIEIVHCGEIDPEMLDGLLDEPPPGLLTADLDDPIEDIPEVGEDVDYDTDDE